MKKLLICFLLMLMIIPAYSASSDEMHELLIPEINEVQPFLNFKFHREPEEGTDQNIYHKLTIYDLFIQATLFPTIENKQVSLQFKGSMADLQKGLYLPNSGGFLPDPLFDPEIGATYRIKLSSGGLLGMNLSVSSASEAPFNDRHHPDIGANIFVRYPVRNNNAWLFYLHYNSTSEYLPDAPVPGIGYLYKSSDGNITALIGAPFAEFLWKPAARLHFKGDWQYPRHIRTEAGVKILWDFTLHANFDWNQTRFRNDLRVRNDDMLNYYEKCLYGGLRYDLGNGVFADAYVGGAFDRYWFEGKDYNDRNYNRINVNDGVIYGFRFRTTF